MFRSLPSSLGLNSGAQRNLRAFNLGRSICKVGVRRDAERFERQFIPPQAGKVVHIEERTRRGGLYLASSVLPPHPLTAFGAPGGRPQEAIVNGRDAAMAAMPRLERHHATTSCSPPRSLRSSAARVKCDEASTCTAPGLVTVPYRRANAKAASPAPPGSLPLTIITTTFRGVPADSPRRPIVMNTAHTTGRSYLLATDGACLRNPGPGGWGVVVHELDGDTIVSRSALAGGADGRTTNNQMELTAAIEGLRSLGDTTLPITIISDSKYLTNGMTKWLPNWKARGWRTSDRKPVKNRDLWMDARRPGPGPHGDLAVGPGTRWPRAERGRRPARQQCGLRSLPRGADLAGRGASGTVQHRRRPRRLTLRPRMPRGIFSGAVPQSGTDGRIKPVKSTSYRPAP